MQSRLVIDNVIRPQLTRGLSVWTAIAINVANMIGTGIFLKSRVMTCNVGSAKAVIAVWVIAGLLSLAGTFSYSELGALMPEAGGDYVFLRRAFGRLCGFVYGWMAFTVARAGSQAALAVGLAVFMNVALDGALGAWSVNGLVLGYHWRIGGLTCVALTAIWSVAVISCASVSTGGRAVLTITIIKIGLLLGLGFGALLCVHGDWAHLAEANIGGACTGVAASARGGIVGFGAALLGALWAYDGWSNVAPLAGEIREPRRNLPRAFIGGTILVGSLYVFANVAYYYVLTPTEVASISTNSSVATEVLRRFLGPSATSLMAVALMLSSLGALQASVLAGSRIPFAMARDGLFFRSLASLSPRSNVPINAILAQAAWSSVLALSGSYDTLTDSVVFAAWIFYGLNTASLFVFRFRLRETARSYRAWGYPFVPIMFLLATTALIVNTFVATPHEAFLGIAILLAGLPFYWYWSRTPTLS